MTEAEIREAFRLQTEENTALKNRVAALETDLRRVQAELKDAAGASA